MPDPLVENAPAKVNLTLRVLGRRADGYHEIESLVVFADFGDASDAFRRGGDLTLTVHGPSAAAAGEGDDNLVLKAARALVARRPDIALGAFELDKRLPVAAGLGGGSADAAAALRLIAEANGSRGRRSGPLRGGPCDRRRCAGLPRSPPAHHARHRRNTLRAVCAAAAAGGAGQSGRGAADQGGICRVEARRCASRSAGCCRDREARRAPTNSCNFSRRRRTIWRRRRSCSQPVIAEVLAALRGLAGCRLARMSGSGATCFATVFAAPTERRRRQSCCRPNSRHGGSSATALGSCTV